jgi:myxalamid-type polyketide synthase MxaE and MxaD
MSETLQVISELISGLEPQDRAALAAALRQAPDSIAVVGMGCRFPGGAEDPESFWELLKAGKDTVREVPRERWDVDAWYDPDPQTPGKMSTRYGAFLDGVDRFDAPFFEISKREAQVMDPQQRLLLEVCWEALERAGIAGDELKSRPVGVFIGSCLHDYETLVHRAGPASFDTHSVTGGMASVLAGRVSYYLGLHGPSLTVDTACSSSLVAVHLACQSLRGGESDVALAAGVNLILSPEGMVMLSRMGALSPDGRCKAFDIRANGFARGEGCGVLVLKRLSDALKAGDRVLALIKGSAVNHDGRSSGLTAPNGLAQRGVLTEALRSAGVSPESVGCIEAHGTGTPLGDPIEVESLKEVFSRRKDGQRCALSSVKTNLGHLESAAGIAGIIKVVLSLQHEALPPHLHFTDLNPRIRLEDSPFFIPTRLEPWPRGKAPRIAGVSSFGLSGTNAHIVLEEAPLREEKAPGKTRPLHLLTLSARSPAALRELAARYAKLWEADKSPSIADVSYSAHTGRARLAYRLALVAASGAQAAEQLQSFVRGKPAAVASGEVATGAHAKVAFVFPELPGSRLAGLGRGLYEAEPVFRRAVDRCSELLRPFLERPLVAVLQGEAGTGALLEQPAYAQPAQFTIQYALAEVWSSWGITPDKVLGKGVGELVAACVAGVLRLEDAVWLVAERGRLGAVRPESSGLARVAESIRYAAPRVGFISSLTGKPASEGEISRAGYWLRQASEAARMTEGLKALRGEGSELVVELGPESLTTREPAGSLDGQGKWIASLPNQGEALGAMLEGLGQLFVRGAKVDWAGFHQHSPGRRVPLPTYPFQRERYWVEARQASGGSEGTKERLVGGAPARAALLGARVRSVGSELRFEALVGTGTPLLRTRRVHGERVASEALHLARLQAAAAEVWGSGLVTIEGVEFARPLVLAAEDEERATQLLLTPAAGAYAFELASIPVVPEGAPVIGSRHASGRLLAPGLDEEASLVRAEALTLRTATPVSAEQFHADLGRLGIEIDPGARWVERAWTRGPEVLAQLRPAAEKGVLDPFLLDACLLVAARAGTPAGAEAALLKELAQWRFLEAPEPGAPVFCRAVAAGDGSVEATLLDEAGRVLVEARGLRFEWPRRDVFLRRVAHRVEDAFYQVEWREKAPKAGSTPAEAGRWLIFADTSGTAAACAARLQQIRGGSCLLVRPGEQFERTSEGWKIRPDHPEDFHRLFEELAATQAPALLGVLHFWALDARHAPESPDAEAMLAEQARVAGGAIHVVQALARSGATAVMPRLYLVTRGARAVGGSTQPLRYEQATLWGLGRAIASEMPSVWGGIVDLDPAAGSGQETLLLESLFSADGETSAVLREGKRWVPRLARCAPPARRSEPAAFRGDATYLITGGLGGLGLEVARWMVRRGARNLVLLGRSAGSAVAREAVAKLQREGARVVARPADVSRGEDLWKVLSFIDTRMPALRGIVHAAGVLEDASLINQDPRAFLRILAPKVAGTQLLHALTQGRKLDFFVLFSSAASVLGNAGQAAYGAANAFLDAFAQYRHGRGEPGLSIGWGPWSEVGMAAATSSHRRAWLQGISPGEGVDLLGYLMRREQAHVVAMLADWTQYTRDNTARNLLVEELAGASEAHPPAAKPAQEPPMVAALRPVAPDAREAFLTDYIGKLIRGVLLLDEAIPLAPDRRLDELGMDSILAVDLMALLRTETGLPLSPNLLTDQPTTGALVRYLGKHLAAVLG